MSGSLLLLPFYSHAAILKQQTVPTIAHPNKCMLLNQSLSTLLSLTISVLARQSTCDTCALQHIHRHHNERQRQQLVDAADGCPQVGSEGGQALGDVLDNLDGALAVCPFASNHHKDTNHAGKEGAERLEKNGLGPPVEWQGVATQHKILL